MSRQLVKCINCQKKRACLLFEVSTPYGYDGEPGYEQAGVVTICRGCLQPIKDGCRDAKGFLIAATLIAHLLEDA